MENSEEEDEEDLAALTRRLNLKGLFGSTGPLNSLKKKEQKIVIIGDHFRVTVWWPLKNQLDHS